MLYICSFSYSLSISNGLPSISLFSSTSRLYLTCQQFLIIAPIGPSVSIPGNLSFLNRAVIFAADQSWYGRFPVMIEYCTEPREKMSAAVDSRNPEYRWLTCTETSRSEPSREEPPKSASFIVEVYLPQAQLASAAARRAFGLSIYRRIWVGWDR